MADHAHALAAAFRACGVESEVLPESDVETMRIGKQYSSGRECYPLALTTGDMIKATRRPDFDPGQKRLLHALGQGALPVRPVQPLSPPGAGPMGLHDVPIVAPMQDDSVYHELGMVGKDFLRLLWSGSRSRWTCSRRRFGSTAPTK